MIITTIDTLLREVWRYEPEILRIIFKFLFTPIYEDKGRKHRYIEVLPQPKTNCISSKSLMCSLALQSLII